MSSKALGWVLENSPYEGKALIIHIVIGDVVNDTYRDEFWMCQQALAKRSRTTDRTVREVLGQMVDDGFLEVLSHEPGEVVRYRFLYPDTPEATSYPPGSYFRSTPEATSGPPRKLLPTITSRENFKGELQGEPQALIVKTKNGSSYPPDFEAFWALYPRKTEKGDALKAWKTMNGTRPSLDVLSVALGWQRRKPGWLKDGGDFIPYPAKWLRARGWEDEQPTRLPYMTEREVNTLSACNEFIKDMRRGE